MQEKVNKGIRWTLLSTITISLVMVVRISMLTAVLHKEDFGIMSIVMFVLALYELIGDFGLSNAILHLPVISSRMQQSLFWVNVWMSVVMCLLNLILAKVLALYYQMPLLTSTLSIAGLSIILSGLGRQQKAMEQKEMKQDFIAIVSMISAIVSAMAAIVLAWHGYGIWSLIIAHLTGTFINFIPFFIRMINRIGLQVNYNLQEVKSVISIGSYSMFSQLINQCARNLDVLVIGKLFPLATLGEYSLAKELAFMPLRVIGPLLQQVFTPYLALISSNQQKLKDYFLRLINVNSLFHLLFVLLFLLAGKWMVYLLYGKAYMSIVPMCQWLFIYAFLRNINSPSGSLLLALGKTKNDFYWNMFCAGLVPLFIWLGSFYQIIGVAISLIIMRLVLLYPSWYFLTKNMIAVSFKEQLQAYINFNYDTWVFIRSHLRR